METMSKIEAVKENIVPLKAGRAASQLAETAQAATRPSSQAAFPPAHDAERAAFETRLVAAESDDDPLEVWLEYLGWMDRICPAGHRTTTELVTRLVRHFVDDERYEKSPKFLRVYLDRYIPSLTDPTAEFAFMLARGIGRKSAAFYIQYAAFLEKQVRFAEVRDIFQRGITEQAKPPQSLRAALDAFEVRASQYVAPAVDAGGADVRPALQAIPPSSRPLLDPHRAAGPAVVHADAVAAPRRAVPATSSALNSQLAVYEDHHDTNASAPRRPLDGAGRGLAPPAAADEVRKENNLLPTTWNDALVPTRPSHALPTTGKAKLDVFVDDDDDGSASGLQREAQASGLRLAGSVPRPRELDVIKPPVALPAPTPVQEAAETVVRKYDYTAVYPTASEEYSFEELRARAAARRATAAAAAAVPAPAAPPVAAVARTRPPLASSTPAAALVPVPVRAMPAPAPVPRAAPTPQTPQTVRAPERETVAAAASVVGVAKASAGHAPSPTINTKFALDEIQGMFQRPLPLAQGADSPADGDDDSGNFGSLLRSRQAAMPVRDVSAALASAEAWRHDAAAASVLAARPRALAPFAVTPASVVRPASAVHTASAAAPALPVRLDAGLIYEDSDDDDDNDAAAPPPPTDGLAPNENVPAPGDENQPPRSMGAADAVATKPSKPTGLGARTGQVFQLLDGTPGPIVQDPALLPALDARALDFEVYEDPTLDLGRPAAATLQLGSIYEDYDDEDDHRALHATALSTSFADALHLDEAEVAPVRMPARDTPVVRGLPADSSEDEEAGASVADPFDDVRKLRLMAQIEADGQLAAMDGYYSCVDSVRGLGPRVKQLMTRGGRPQRLEFPLELRFERYRVLSLLGAGAYASVFLVARSDIDQDEPVLLALKFQTPSSGRDMAAKWDFVMVRRLTARLPPAFQASICPAHSLHIYSDESYLVTDYGHHGTLLNMINMFRAKSQPIPEVLVIFYTVELLRIVEGMHAAGFVHGDIKADNILMRFDPVADDAEVWDRQYQLDGSKGWSRCGIQLIDFGRAIDLTLFPPDTGFSVHGEPADAFKFVDRICNDRPWRFQIDYFGVCNVVYNLLHCNYMEIVQAAPFGRHSAGSDTGLRWRPAEPFKRYWQSDVWIPMFDTLLNHDSIDPCPEIATVRASLESYLAQNAHKQARTLKSLLQEQEADLLQDQQQVLGVSV